MQNELKEKLQNLSEKFNAELDMISLKALCNMPESEEISFAITGTLNRLIEKYPDDEEILGLLSKKEKISLEELVTILEEKYPSNVEVITIKALSALPEGELREKAVAQSLERLLEENSDDENIINYLEIDNTIPKDFDPDMVFVQGGSYTPSFFRDERKVCDLFVSKYQTTQIKWREMMGTNPSKFKGDKRPVEEIKWIRALEYCNKLSEHYGLQPVYKIVNNDLRGIIHNDGEEVAPYLADFSKTEGYRLPTELEWEWFARGGKVGIQEGTFIQYKYFAGLRGFNIETNTLNEIAWYHDNSFEETHNVGTKKPNQLGLYDCFGNVNEWCYDTDADGYVLEERLFAYDFHREDIKIIRGGSYDTQLWLSRSFRSVQSGSSFFTGFRVVRTANPQK